MATKTTPVKKKNAAATKSATGSKSSAPTPKKSAKSPSSSSPTSDDALSEPVTESNEIPSPPIDAAPPTGRGQGAGDIAARVLSGEYDKTIVDLGDDLASGKRSVAANAARILDEVIDQKPEAVVPIIDRFAKVIAGPDKRPAQCAARALPLMARIAPARVARHLTRLKDGFDGATAPGKDGLVRTFAGLCTASVAYQKKLEDVLNRALSQADAKTLITWTTVVLPALKGEPHARARATVEARLGRIPKVHAQKIADFLGIRLRLRYR